MIFCAQLIVYELSNRTNQRFLTFKQEFQSNCQFPSENPFFPRGGDGDASHPLNFHPQGKGLIENFCQQMEYINRYYIHILYTEFQRNLVEGYKYLFLRSLKLFSYI